MQILLWWVYKLEDAARSPIEGWTRINDILCVFVYTYNRRGEQIFMKLRINIQMAWNIYVRGAIAFWFMQFVLKVVVLKDLYQNCIIIIIAIMRIALLLLAYKLIRDFYFCIVCTHTDVVYLYIWTSKMIICRVIKMSCLQYAYKKENYKTLYLIAHFKTFMILFAINRPF